MTRKLRILVLGTEHFAGSKVARALAASDWASPETLPAAAATLTAAHLDGIHAVFNGTMGSPAHIGAQARALYALLEGGRRDIRVVQLSSMTVYGSQQAVVTEDAVLRADLGAYGAAHIAAEAAARRHPRSVILRPGCEYGPDCPQWTGRIARLLLAHRLGDLGAGGDGICNLVYADDLVAAVIGALTLPDVDGACFNLAMRGPPTWNCYLSLFARALGAVPVARIGQRRLRMEAAAVAPPLKVLEKIAHLLPGRAFSPPPPITRSLLALCRQDITLESGRAERQLGLTWTPLALGIGRAAAAFQGR